MYDVPHTVVSGGRRVTRRRRSEWDWETLIGGGGDEGGDKWGRGWRATRSGAQRGEASGDDLKRAPVAPARGRRSGCMARLLTMGGGAEAKRRRRRRRRRER